jgi:hypothetical protein
MIGMNETIKPTGIGRRLTHIVLASVALFLVVNMASYFLRSDGYGIIKGDDLITRVGCPFLILENGGVAPRRRVSGLAFFGNLGVAFASVIFVGCLVHFLGRAGNDAT